ncbi:Conserved_hypothetical protein [Hexamita inflata]|uniref:Transmembrane protein n=1 Tax=Hexamita inflata TaxID=28002 RepID=A0AA86P103_9EUKA|nr:Conserved hypothetical protein [Hexamita inflata]
MIFSIVSVQVVTALDIQSTQYTIDTSLVLDYLSLSILVTSPLSSLNLYFTFPNSSHVIFPINSNTTQIIKFSLVTQFVSQIQFDSYPKQIYSVPKICNIQVVPQPPIIAAIQPANYADIASEYKKLNIVLKQLVQISVSSSYEVQTDLNCNNKYNIFTFKRSNVNSASVGDTVCFVSVFNNQISSVLEVLLTSSNNTTNFQTISLISWAICFLLSILCIIIGVTVMIKARPIGTFYVKK